MNDGRALFQKVRHTARELILLLLIILVSGCSAGPEIVQPNSRYTGTGPNKVYVVSHGWHTGFVLPSADIQEYVPELKRRFADAPHIELGWGDRDFYQAQQVTFGLMLSAVLWPTPSVVHAVAVPDEVENYFANSQIEILCLSDHELALLARFISNSFYKDGEDNVSELKAGIYGDSQFYKGVGDYYLLNTCNEWTAKGLKSVGMDIWPTFKLTAGSIMDYLANEKPKLLAEEGSIHSGMGLSCGP